jgi:general secretion pathway protein G
VGLIYSELRSTPSNTGREQMRVAGSTSRWRHAVAGRAPGFTLIELLLVLAILAILAGLIVPRFVKRSEVARVAAATADIRANLANALELYELDNGAFPSTQQGLKALLEEPNSPPFPANWNGPYVRSTSFADPWGHPYQYRSPALAPGMDYDLFSYGPDGVEGGGDDISNASVETH